MLYIVVYSAIKNTCRGCAGHGEQCVFVPQRSYNWLTFVPCKKKKKKCNIQNILTPRDSFPKS